MNTKYLSNYLLSQALSKVLLSQPLEVMMPSCRECNDTGVIETGNNDLPCDCLAGATAKFNVAGVRGPVSGAEVKRHYLNDSPEPIRPTQGKRIN
jgi:hypothetical protein